ncbi:MAG: hypothetical protein AMXMBFR53_26180 [Gemmatimonadota bacterium]
MPAAASGDTVHVHHTGLREQAGEMVLSFSLEELPRGADPQVGRHLQVSRPEGQAADPTP